MDEQFCMFFSSDALLTWVPQQNGQWEETDPAVIQEAFFQALSPGDEVRFKALCRKEFLEGSGSNRYDGMGVFRLNDFYGYTCAFAEKNAEKGKDSIAVTFFRNTKKLSQRLSPVYLRLFPLLGTAEETKRSFLSPVADSAGGGHTEEHTDVKELTERILSFVREDPLFYGNRFHLTEADSFGKEGEDGKDVPVFRFSSADFAKVLYALFGAMMEATVSHEFDVRVETCRSVVSIGIETMADNGGAGALHEVTDLGSLSPFARTSGVLTALAEYLSAANGFGTGVSFSEDSGVLAVRLSLTAESRSEGDFRYRPLYGDLAGIVREAARVVRLLAEDRRFA